MWQDLRLWSKMLSDYNAEFLKTKTISKIKEGI